MQRTAWSGKVWSTSHLAAASHYDRSAKAMREMIVRESDKLNHKLNALERRVPRECS